MKELNQEVLMDLYSRMTTIREFEKEAIELAKMNLTRAAIHTYNGEEAIGVGVCAHLTNDDYIVSNHRGHGHCIAKGADLRRMFAELMARETGYCKGKGGSMHIADMDVGMLGANGIVGGGIPIAIGAALAQKYMNGGRTCGVISFELTGGREAAVRFMDSLKLATIATHVAASKTMILHPASHTHRQMNDEQLAEAGVSPGMIRLSVGIENADDIIADIEQALQNA